MVSRQVLRYHGRRPLTESPAGVREATPVPSVYVCGGDATILIVSSSPLGPWSASGTMAQMGPSLSLFPLLSPVDRPLWRLGFSGLRTRALPPRHSPFGTTQLLRHLLACFPFQVAQDDGNSVLVR